MHLLIIDILLCYLTNKENTINQKSSHTFIHDSIVSIFIRNTKSDRGPLIYFSLIFLNFRNYNSTMSNVCEVVEGFVNVIS